MLAARMVCALTVIYSETRWETKAWNEDVLSQNLIRTYECAT